uniref:BRMS1 like transcriptional repressor b n=1 Tax=Fundulus heteroclitus TaxID=8078 RepID=A0A3Q2NX30_FUNHE
MPVHSREKKDSNHEEMEVDFPEQDGSSTDEEDTVSSSVSEDGDSSEMDDEDCERRRMECLDEMTTLEKQFTDLKDTDADEFEFKIDTAALKERSSVKLWCPVCPVCIAELWNDGLQARKNKKKDPFCPVKKKKPVVLFIRPYIVYMLQDLDILEDWTAIRKAMASLGPHRVKVDGKMKPDRHHHVARPEEGRLFYDNQWYCRGQAICINRKDEFPTSAIITTINNDEVWFKRLDGTKSKLYISQLQKGKYTIKHS